jgi:3-oxoacyl-[acyl-carrier-protein] synthase-3
MNTYSKVIGTGSYFPPKVFTNFDFEKKLDTSDEWIRTRTGIVERRIAETETNLDMAYEASKKALEMANIKPEEIDGIVLATFTPDYSMPSTACCLQSRLGAKKGFAFDMAAACSGFIYAMGVADSMIKNGLADTILVVGSEKLSSTLDWNDRTTCILFGDGAGAVVLKKDNAPGIRSVFLAADGDHGHLLSLHAIGVDFLSKRKEVNPDELLIKMKGNEVFKIAVRAMADAAEKAVIKSGLNYEDIDYFIPHQANLRIIDAAAKKLKLDHDKVIITLDKYGNTSSATIPTSLDIAVREGKIQRGHNVVSAAFGGGLTWGSMLFTF